MREVTINSKWKCVCGCKSIYTILIVYYGTEQVVTIDQSGLQYTYHVEEFFNRTMAIVNGVEMMIRCL